MNKSADYLLTSNLEIFSFFLPNLSAATEGSAVLDKTPPPSFGWSLLPPELLEDAVETEDLVGKFPSRYLSGVFGSSRL